MIELFLFLLLPVTHSVTHTLRFFFTVSSGIPNFPEVMAVGTVNDIEAGYCDINRNFKVKQDWMEKIFNDPQQLEWYQQECFEIEPKSLKTRIDNLKRRLNQSEGVHILQRMSGCDWDDETGDVVGFNQFGYDGEDFISLDLETQTWIAAKPQAVTTKLTWDAERDRMKRNKIDLTQVFPALLKTYVEYGENVLLRTDLPSVSLLQKTPSSPVSCHATGFYPDKADLFWRKDGEQLHEDVDHGEILPNKDGTFQMRVDLNLSSVRPEDWSRYDCVFQLSGVKNHIITKLDKDQIRTNWGGDPQFPVAAVIGAVVGLLLLAACISGLFIWRKKNNEVFQVSSQETIVNFHQTQVQVQCDHISDRSDTNVTVEENTPGATTSGEK
ncbi:major histocompatibility complex class I-related gene protein-like [Mastacembelus armatus]|uniref:major histocompatibility complex class I-related gene protein-like n=1 Tax=Mastacembelus armatus TaxID=205130 RepID=UPI000E45BCFE|nr:major histocompatibility complex class I-related gene protein-like [Mastacembelus armatus]